VIERRATAQTWRRPAAAWGRRRTACPPAKQQVRLRRDGLDGQAPHHSLMVRRDPASLGVSSASGTLSRAHRSDTSTPGGDAGLFRTTDAARRGQELPACAGHGTGPSVNRAAGGMCLTPSCSIRRTPAHVRRHLGRGAFRSMTAEHVERSNRGCAPVHPRPERRGGPLRAPHRAEPVATQRLFMQKHWDVMRSGRRDRGTRSAGNLPTDFGFVIDVHAPRADTVYCGPIRATPSITCPTASCAYSAAAPAGTSGKPCPGLAATRLLREVLRDAMAIDSLDQCGVLGTTGGQVYLSPIAGQLDADRSRSPGRAVGRVPDLK